MSFPKEHLSTMVDSCAAIVGIVRAGKGASGPGYNIGMGAHPEHIRLQPCRLAAA
jgi:hypothetical protein